MALVDIVIVHIACGWDHSLAVTDHGQLYAWGAGTNGKLGHGDENDRSIPTLVTSMSNVYVVQAEAGEFLKEKNFVLFFFSKIFFPDNFFFFFDFF